MLEMWPISGNISTDHEYKPHLSSCIIAHHLHAQSGLLYLTPLGLKQYLSFTLIVPSLPHFNYYYLRQLRLYDHILIVCDNELKSERCDIQLDRRYNDTTQYLKTIDMFKAALERLPYEKGVSKPVTVPSLTMIIQRK